MRTTHAVPIFCLLLIMSCGEERPSEWPAGAREAVEDWWCEGECLEVELLVFERRADVDFDIEFILVFVHAQVPEWDVGRFQRSTDMPGWTKQHITDRPTYYECFDHRPDFEEVKVILSIGNRGPDCGTVFNETWLRLFGETLARNSYLASCEP
jgi:hypothetical protein